MSGYINTLTISTTAAANLTKNRFISPTGTVATAGANSIGVAFDDATSGNTASVIVLGTVSVVADGTIARGAEIEVGSSGKAKTKTSTNKVVGRALKAATDGNECELYLIAN